MTPRIPNETISKRKHTSGVELIESVCMFQYSFVTPLTSMVVTKPDKPAENTEEDSDSVKDAPKSQPARGTYIS